MGDISTIERWLNIIGASGSTRWNYEKDLKRFEAFKDIKLDVLVSEAHEDIRKGLLPSERRISHIFGEYQAHLDRQVEEDQIAPNSCSRYLASVRSFLKVNDITLPYLKKRGRKAKALPKNHKKYLKADDVRKMADTATNLRDRTVILCGFQSGQGVGEIINLRYRDIKEDYESGRARIRLYIQRKKTGSTFHTFFGKDATKALRDYLDWRKREAGKNPYYAIEGEDDYVFINYSMDNRQKREVDGKGVQRTMKLIADKLGYGREKGAFNPIRFHALRSAFYSNIVNHGGDAAFADYLMGHENSEVRQAYHHPDPDLLEEKYKEYEPYLSISVVIPPPSEYIKKLEEDNKRLKEQLENLEIEQARSSSVMPEQVAVEVGNRIKGLERNILQRVLAVGLAEARSPDMAARGISDILPSSDRDVTVLSLKENRKREAGEIIAKAITTLAREAMENKDPTKVRTAWEVEQLAAELRIPLPSYEQIAYDYSIPPEERRLELVKVRSK